jgi:hypothetical protein
VATAYSTTSRNDWFNYIYPHHLFSVSASMHEETHTCKLKTHETILVERKVDMLE